jgi:hypothetical protein
VLIFKALDDASQQTVAAAAPPLSSLKDEATEAYTTAAHSADNAALCASAVNQ